MELYNIINDIGETQNIAKDNHEIVKTLDSIRLERDKQLINPVFEGLMTNKKKEKTAINNYIKFKD